MWVSLVVWRDSSANKAHRHGEVQEYHASARSGGLRAEGWMEGGGGGETRRVRMVYIVYILYIISCFVYFVWFSFPCVRRSLHFTVLVVEVCPLSYESG